MAATRRVMRFMVEVSVPAKVDGWEPYKKRRLTAAEVAREIRTGVNNFSAYALDEGTVKIRRVRYKGEGACGGER